MAIEHLAKKRTGRPKGARSASPCIRDARWVYQHLGKPDAEPPSAFARLLLALARKRPDRFFACLVMLEKGKVKASPSTRPAPLNDAGLVVNDGPPRRLKKITVYERSLFDYLRGERGPGGALDPPQDARVVHYGGSKSQRAIHLVLASVMFPEVATGEPIPELERE
jgi:hypothetical protein